MKDLSNIELTYNNIIDTLLSSRAHAVNEFETRAEDAKRQLSESGLRYLDVSKDILQFISWAVELMVVDTKIIQNYQKYVEAIFENMNEEEDLIAGYEVRVKELEEENDALREKNKKLAVKMRNLLLRRAWGYDYASVDEEGVPVFEKPKDVQVKMPPAYNKKVVEAPPPQPVSQNAPIPQSSEEGGGWDDGIKEVVFVKEAHEVRGKFEENPETPPQVKPQHDIFDDAGTVIMGNPGLPPEYYIRSPDTHLRWGDMPTRAKSRDAIRLRKHLVEMDVIPVNKLKRPDQIEPLNLTPDEASIRSSNPRAILYGAPKKIVFERSTVKHSTAAKLYKFIQPLQPIFVAEIVRRTKAELGWTTFVIEEAIKYIAVATGRVYYLSEILIDEALHELKTNYPYRYAAETGDMDLILQEMNETQESRQEETTENVEENA